MTEDQRYWQARACLAEDSDLNRPDASFDAGRATTIMLEDGSDTTLNEAAERILNAVVSDLETTGQRQLTAALIDHMITVAMGELATMRQERFG